jgi:hypothetical protein
MSTPEPLAYEAFENFPHGQLAFRFTRRQLWSALTNEFVVSGHRQHGQAALSLADLGEFTDEDLMPIVPVVTPGCKISVEEGFVCGKPSTATETVQLFTVSSPALRVFNLFNGQTSLGEAADQFKPPPTEDWDAARRFAFVRGLFLCLVLAGLCAPKDSLYERHVDAAVQTT